jgi:regulator of RNase E activity RraA
LVVIDNTGIVVVPQDKLLAVLTAAEELNRRDADFAARLKTDGSFARAAASLKHA